MRYMTVRVVLTKSVLAGVSYLLECSNEQTVAHVVKAAATGMSKAMEIVDVHFAKEERDDREREERERIRAEQDRPNRDRFIKIENEIRELRQGVESLYQLSAKQK